MDQLTATLGALADPTRRGILDRLAQGPSTVGELAAPFRVSQQAVSKHIACLEKAKLVEKRRLGRIHVCSLRAEPLDDVVTLVEGYRRLWEQSFDKLDAYLREIQAPGAASATAGKKQPRRSDRTSRKPPSSPERPRGRTT